MAPDVRTVGAYGVAEKPARKNVRTVATSEGERLHIRIPPDLKEVARELAEEDGRTLSNWMLRLIREEVERKRSKPS